MRRIRIEERKKRGCDYCENVIPPNPFGKYPTRKCPYKECPYHELDNVKTYGEYLKKTGTLSITKLLNLKKRTE